MWHLAMGKMGAFKNQPFTKGCMNLINGIILNHNCVQMMD
jgi:hypothetical protein